MNYIGLSTTGQAVKNLDFSSFQHELGLHIAKKESLIDFDEDLYLNANRDVAEAVAKGIYSCAHRHYCLAGQYEGRAWRRESEDVVGQSALEFEIPTDCSAPDRLDSAVGVSRSH